MVRMSRDGSLASNAVLMRAWRVVPAMFTHKSRGNDSTATSFTAGSTRSTMIVSLRSPNDVRSPMPPAVPSPLSGHAPLSEPVRRKFSARKPLVSRFHSSTGEPSGVVAPGVAGDAPSMFTTRRSPTLLFAHTTATPTTIKVAATSTLATSTMVCERGRLPNRAVLM